MWGAFWNWDPRQTSIVVVLVFYAAYLVLRGAIADPRRARLAAAYAVLGLVVAPFLFFVLPRLAFTLHPEPVSTPGEGRDGIADAAGAAGELGRVHRTLLLDARIRCARRLAEVAREPVRAPADPPRRKPGSS
jgi:hypothetical protein